jgi:putative restriction endonuclease
MGSGKRWTRDELLVVLNLYHKLRFGQFHRRQPVIMEVAERLGRTPDAVAMKLSNLASLDPALKLRGIAGLPGASDLDKEIWAEFHAAPAEFIPRSQERFDALFVDDDHETTEVIPSSGVRRVSRSTTAGTDVLRPAKQRRGQTFFRDAVLNNYDNRCAVTGLPVRELLVASHILPWSDAVAERLNVANGIALNRLHDAAFDQGLISFDDDLRLVLSARLKRLLPEEAVRASFEAHEGQSLRLPDDAVAPNGVFLARHRERLEAAA